MSYSSSYPKVVLLGKSLLCLNHCLKKLHFYPFGGIKKTSEWLDSLKKSEFIFKIIENIHKAPKKVIKIFNEFVMETKNELWNSEEEMVKYYKKSENYKKLVSGEAGGNLIYKYKSRNIVEAMPEWTEFLTSLISQ